MRSAWTATSFLRRRGPHRAHCRRSGRRPCRAGTDPSALPGAKPTQPRAKRASIEKSQPSAWRLTRRFAKALPSLRLEVHGDAIDAVAQVRRRRAVLEYVAEMAAAAAAMHLGAHHAVAAVLGALHRARDRIVEARPAGAALELLLGDEQRLAAARAGEGAGALLVIERAAAGGLGAVAAQDVVLLGREQAAPLLVGVGDRVLLACHALDLLCSTCPQAVGDFAITLPALRLTSPASLRPWPSAARISSLCWPSVGGGVSIRGPPWANVKAASGTPKPPSMPGTEAWRWTTPRLASCGSASASPMVRTRAAGTWRACRNSSHSSALRVSMISESTAISRAWSASRSSLVRLIMSRRPSTVHSRRCWRRLLAPSITSPSLVSKAPLVAWGWRLPCGFGCTPLRR